MKKVNFLNPIRKGISLTLLFFVFAQHSQSQNCNCSAMYNGNFIRMNAGGQISFHPDANLTMDFPNNLAGKFVVWQNGFIGVNVQNSNQANAANTKARFHLNGTAIIQDQTLIGTGGSIDKWLALSVNSKNAWGLWVDKGIVATNYAITTPDKWADYVFDSTYKLRPLNEVEQFLKANKHLPEIPSQQKIKEEGYTVHDMNTRFMQKIEELTLYIIEQDKQITELTSRLEKMETMLASPRKKRK